MAPRAGTTTLVGVLALLVLPFDAKSSDMSPRSASGAESARSKLKEFDKLGSVLFMTFIGLLLAALTVIGTFYEGGTGTDGRHVILAPLFILAIPLYDFTSVMLIRLGRGHSPFRPDKNHFSHRLVELTRIADRFLVLSAGNLLADERDADATRLESLLRGETP